MNNMCAYIIFSYWFFMGDSIDIIITAKYNETAKTIILDKLTNLTTNISVCFGENGLKSCANETPNEAENLLMTKLQGVKIINNLQSTSISNRFKSFLGFNTKGGNFTHLTRRRFKKRNGKRSYRRYK